MQVIENCFLYNLYHHFFFLLRRRLDVSSQSRQMIKIVQSVNISSNQTLTSACLSKVWLCKASQQLAS